MYIWVELIRYHVKIWILFSAYMKLTCKVVAFEWLQDTMGKFLQDPSTTFESLKTKLEGILAQVKDKFGKLAKTVLGCKEYRWDHLKLNNLWVEISHSAFTWSEPWWIFGSYWRLRWLYNSFHDADCHNLNSIKLISNYSMYSIGFQTFVVVTCIVWRRTGTWPWPHTLKLSVWESQETSLTKLTRSEYKANVVDEVGLWRHHMRLLNLGNPP